MVLLPKIFLTNYKANFFSKKLRHSSKLATNLVTKNIEKKSKSKSHWKNCNSIFLKCYLLKKELKIRTFLHALEGFESNLAVKEVSVSYLSSGDNLVIKTAIY